ncbi:MAG: hypothetical protein HY975_04630, partial [Candidatus Kerfeldbacteria bacterium]|nr:hypothetical protein [Candidatus Kerfeldbacteria bacterium]
TGLLKNMTPEIRKKMTREIDLKNEASLDRRAMVAEATGEWGNAFLDRNGQWMMEDEKDKNGQTKLDTNGAVIRVATARKYAEKLQGDDLAKNLTETAGSDDQVLEMLRTNKNFKAKDWETLRSRKEMREALQTGFDKAESSLSHDAAGNVNIPTDKNSEEYRRVTSILKQQTLAYKGAKIPKNALVKDSPERQLVEDWIRSGKAGDFGDIYKSDLWRTDQQKEQLARIIGTNATPKFLSDMITEESFDVGTAAVQGFALNYKDAFEKGGAGEYDGMPKDKLDQLKEVFNSRKRTFKRDSILSRYAAFGKIDESTDEDEEDETAGHVAESLTDVGTAAVILKEVKGISDRFEQALRETVDKLKGNQPPEEPDLGPSPAPRTPPPPAGGGSRAAREAAAARPAAPGSRIVVPPGSDFPTREERDEDPRIASLTPEQKKLRQTAVDARRLAETKFLTEEEKYNKAELMKGLLTEQERAEYEDLDKLTNFNPRISPQGRMTPEQSKRYHDLNVKLGIQDPVPGEPVTVAQGARPPERPKPAPTAPPVTPPQPTAPKEARPTPRREQPTATEAPAVTVDTSALEQATRDLAEIQRAMTGDLTHVAENFGDYTKKLNSQLDLIRASRPNTANQLQNDLRKIDPRKVAGGDQKELRNMNDVLKEIRRHIKTMSQSTE